MPDSAPVYLPAIRKDIQDIALWTEDHFGVAAADRYAALIAQALQDIEEDPQRPGTTGRPELAANAFVYHLRHSRERVTAGIVKKPRHFLLYRHIDTYIEFARLLHDSRDLAQHLPLGYQSND